MALLDDFLNYDPTGGAPPYTDTSQMGLLTQTPLNKGAPPGWGRRPPPAQVKTVSLEGGRGPGQPSPAPDSGPISGRSPDASGAPDVTNTGKTGNPGIAASDQDQTLQGRGRGMGQRTDGSWLSKLGDMLNDRSSTLMALGAGFAGAQSPGLGLSRALQLAGPAMQQDIAQQRQNMTVQALIGRGLDPQLAKMAAYNPDVMKAMLPALGFGVKEYQPITLTDAFGNQHVVSYDKQTGRLITGPGGGGEASTGVSSEDAVSAMRDYLATGKLPKDENLAILVSATSAYMNGEAIPTGNPRQRTISTMARTLAQRMAAELGRPDLADEGLYKDRLSARLDLNRSGNSNMGGILDNGASAFHHLGLLGDAMVNQGQAGSNEYWGPNWLAQAQNYLRNRVMGGTETAGNLTAVQTAAGHFGQESTKFYAGTGGSTPERLHALETIAGPGTAADQQAAYLETEKNLMLERLNAKMDHLEGTIPGALDKKMPHYKENLERDIAKIDTAIAKLRAGKTGRATAEAPAAKTWPTPPPAAIADLRKAPNTRGKFDEVFGPGAAARALGGK